MKYELEEINLIQPSHDQANHFLAKQIRDLIHLFIEHKNSLPKYQVFELLTSPYWENGVSHFVGIKQPISYGTQQTRDLIPDNPEDLDDIIELCTKNILSQTLYKICQKVIIYDQNNQIQRFAIMLKDPIPQYSDIGLGDMLVKDNNLLYDFSHPQDELPSTT